MPSSKNQIERAGGWGAASLNASVLILSVVKEAVALAPFQELKQAASVALVILNTIQAVKDNREAYELLGHDAGQVFVDIWLLYKKDEDQKKWLSTEMRSNLVDLTHTLGDISSFVKEQLSRSKTIRVIFSKADAGKISEYRGRLTHALLRFGLRSHINVDGTLMDMDEKLTRLLHRNDEEDVKRTQELTVREAREREEAEKAVEKAHEEELKTVKGISVRLKQVEIDHQDEDETWYSDQLKKIEKEAKDRQSELERLRAAASARELANRLRKAEEAEIAMLKRQLAAERRSKRQGEVEEEEEEEEVRPVRRSNVTRKPSKSPKRRPVSSNYEDLQSQKSSNVKTGRRRLSSTSLRVDESTDEEEGYADNTPLPPRNSPKVDRLRPQGSSNSPPRDVDDMTAQFGGSMPWGLGSPHWSGPNPRSNAPMYFPMYGSPPPMDHYGYMPRIVFNSGVGNTITNTTTNVGNDNSVTKVYYARTRSQRRSAGNWNTQSVSILAPVSVSTATTAKATQSASMVCSRCMDVGRSETVIEVVVKNCEQRRTTS